MAWEKSQVSKVHFMLLKYILLVVKEHIVIIWIHGKKYTTVFSKIIVILPLYIFKFISYFRRPRTEIANNLVNKQKVTHYDLVGKTLP